MPTKPADKAKATRKAANKAATSVEPAKPGRSPNGLQKPLQPSRDLSAIVGADVLPRGEVASKIWAYIKATKLQNPENGREIVADDKLRKVFGKDRVTMFEMNKYLSQHLT